MKKKQNILIVDDSEIIIERIRLLLSEVENVGSIEHAHSFITAIAELFSRKVNVVLLDANLPGKESLEIVRWIKEKKIPVLVIIALGDDTTDDRYSDQLIKSGAHHFIDKFDDFEELGKIISCLE